LLALFLLTFSATKFGRSKKEQLGVAEDKHGRNAAQVAANLGIAGLAAAAALSLPSLGPWCAVAVTAALAEATADTLASELGEVLGGQPFMVTTFRRVPPGRDGAVSLAGTVAGTCAAAVVVLVAVLALGLSPGKALCAGLGAIAGLFVDSLLGATAERRGWLNNDAVNFLSTLAAAAIAIGALTLRLDAGRVPWYPTQAKIGLEWGTQGDLPGRIFKTSGGASPVFFGPGTLWRTWGTRPIPSDLAMTQTLSGLVPIQRKSWVPHSSLFWLEWDTTALNPSPSESSTATTYSSPSHASSAWSNPRTPGAEPPAGEKSPR
jgi:uncharacterized protein (TIGR00297 family)